MSQVWGNALCELMCQGRLDMMMTIMAEGQLKRHVPQKHMMRFEDVKDTAERHVQ